jgi:hypothetical protein
MIHDFGNELFISDYRQGLVSCSFEGQVFVWFLFRLYFDTSFNFFLFLSIVCFFVLNRYHIKGCPLLILI